MDIQIPTYEDDSIVSELILEYNKSYGCDFEITNFEVNDGVAFATISSDTYSREDVLRVGSVYATLIRKMTDEGLID